MNPAVRRPLLNELSIITHIGEEIFVAYCEAALEEEIDFLGEQFLGRSIDPKEA